MVAPLLRRLPLGSTLLATTALTGILGGCGAQADTSYRGEPLAELHGTVQQSSTHGSSSTPALDAALLFNGAPPGVSTKDYPPRLQIGTSVPVSGQFPASFALQVYTPPPSGALFPCIPSQPDGPGRIATASVVAVLHGADPSSPKITDLYGTISDYMVIYVDSELPAQSSCPVGALTKGYHLFHYVPTPDKPGCVRAAPDDTSCNGPWPYTEVSMSTELTLALSHEDGTAQPPSGPLPPSLPPGDAGPEPPSP
ncbi:hypothetical protein AKJ09_09976 [Labilithrix luteola]|uniref:Lipoprotein n=1 Tax=Labilithrix luteola TaxID=1391654 RepID=A0A0K1QC61_9BACT|nr:hypothetical protein [Labilithrix luteola]AKV03313.1 hypothetical protein AKJ09_09976 [Labilithrix luteola]